MSTNPPLPPFPEDGTGHDGRRPAGPEQPPSIVTAVLLMRIGAGVALVSAVYALATLGGLKDQIRDDLAAADQTVTAPDIDTAYSVAVGSIIVFGVLAAGLWLWMAWANGRGRKWARIVATVFGSINIVTALFTLTAGQTTAVSTIVTVINLFVGIAALFYLYRSDSSQFYQASSRPAY